MGKKIRMNKAMTRRVVELIEKHGLSGPAVLGCKEQAEFDLSQPKDERDARRVQRGHQWFYEFETSLWSQGRPFKVVIEYEYDGDSAEMLEVHIVDTKLNLHNE